MSLSVHLNILKSTLESQTLTPGAVGPRAKVSTGAAFYNTLLFQ